jgi:hypothetical protein
MRFSPRYYVLLVHLVKIKKLFNKARISPASASNRNSLRASILDEFGKNKEIIQVNVITRALRGLRQSLNQVQDYCLRLIPSLPALIVPPSSCGIHMPTGPFLMPRICQFHISKKPLWATPQTLYPVGIGLFGTVVVSFDRPLYRTIISSTAKSRPCFQTLDLTS